MSADAREIVDQHRDLPIIEVGRILVDRGQIATPYMRPRTCIAAYWQHQQARIQRGEIERGCDGPCEPWKNNSGLAMCPRSGLICAGHCQAQASEASK